MIEISNSEMKVAFNIKGAELISFFDMQAQRELLWDADPKVWGKHAPILFPVVGSLKESTYYYKGVPYKLPRHGFARDQDFELVRHSEDEAVFELKADEQSLKNYPFDFILRVRYALAGKVLHVEYQVENRGREIMHFSVGAHPGFKCNLKSGTAYLSFIGTNRTEIERLRVSLETGLILKERSTIQLSEQRLILNEEVFEEDAIIVQGQQIRGFKLGDLNEGDYLGFKCENYDYVGIWSPKGPFVCIEPWHGIADFEDTNQMLDEKVAIQHLAAGQKFTCGYSIESLIAGA